LFKGNFSENNQCVLWNKDNLKFLPERMEALT
jgi:hypothetical protein